MLLNEILDLIPNNHRPTPDEIAAVIRTCLKKFNIRAKITKSKSSVRFDFAVVWDNLSKAGKKKLDIIDNNVGTQGNWSDERMELKRQLARDDKVYDRYVEALTEILAEIKKIGAKQFGYVKDTPGTSGFGGYDVANDFNFFDVKGKIKIDEKWIEYTTYKVTF